MHELIITRILNRGMVTLSELEDRASQRGLSLSDLYAALDKVHRDKRIKRGVRQGEVYYEPAPPPKTPTDHLKWVRDNYPYPDNFIMPFPEIDYSWIVMSPDEAKAYKAEAKGVPLFMYNKRRHG